MQGPAREGDEREMAFPEEVSPELSLRPSRGFSGEEKASQEQGKACLSSIKGRGDRKRGSG